MKLFVTDYDNTLYVNDEEIKEAIKELERIRKKDFKVVISTGRSIPSIKKEVIKHNIPFDYLSCADGSLIYDNNYNLLKEHHMDKEIIKEIPNLVKNITYEEIQYSYDTGYENYLDLSKNISSVNIVIFENCYNNEMRKRWIDLQKRFPTYNYLNYKHFYSVTKSYLYYLCIKNKDVSKSKGIEFLANHLNINKEDIYVIGDSDNDYEMIRDFNGVCVTNSTDQIKQVSKCVYKKISDFLKEL